ncbi:hypothetical protein D0894_14345 [Pseudomonas monteilii]|uniref:Uncharacterized protein n=1 Tax=Pseudomonas monteilii TaxID=76759 RepID=A0A399M5N1_9PSED|nr:hypothetical protein D0894_14345 [Pseudomonas monteilii]
MQWGHGVILDQDGVCLCRPFRGQARSHRYGAVLGNCAIPVGAGLPAKRPVLAADAFSQS